MRARRSAPNSNTLESCADGYWVRVHKFHFGSFVAEIPAVSIWSPRLSARPLRVWPTPVIDVDLTDPATFAGGIPHELFARLRREDPVAWHPWGDGGFWSLTRYDDVVRANRDTG